MSAIRNDFKKGRVFAWMQYYDREEIRSLEQQDRLDENLLGEVRSSRSRVIGLQRIEELFEEDAKRHDQTVQIEE